MTSLFSPHRSDRHYNDAHRAIVSVFSPNVLVNCHDVFVLFVLANSMYLFLHHLDLRIQFLLRKYFFLIDCVNLSRLCDLCMFIRSNVQKTFVCIKIIRAKNMKISCHFRSLLQWTRKFIKMLIANVPIVVCRCSSRSASASCSEPRDSSLEEWNRSRAKNNRNISSVNQIVKMKMFEIDEREIKNTINAMEIDEKLGLWIKKVMKSQTLSFVDERNIRQTKYNFKRSWNKTANVTPHRMRLIWCKYQQTKCQCDYWSCIVAYENFKTLPN